MIDREKLIVEDILALERSVSSLEMYFHKFSNDNKENSSKIVKISAKLDSLVDMLKANDKHMHMYFEALRSDGRE